MSSAIDGVAAATRMMYSRQAYADTPAPTARAVASPRSVPETTAPSSSAAPQTDSFPAGETPSFEAARRLRESRDGSGADINSIVESANSSLALKNRSLRFRVNPDTNAVQIQVVDSNRDKVIRSIPSDDMIAMASRMRDLSGIGAMVDLSR